MERYLWVSTRGENLFVSWYSTGWQCDTSILESCSQSLPSPRHNRLPLKCYRADHCTEFISRLRWVHCSSTKKKNFAQLSLLSHFTTCRFNLLDYWKERCLLFIYRNFTLYFLHFKFFFYYQHSLIMVCNPMGFRDNMHVVWMLTAWIRARYLHKYLTQAPSAPLWWNIISTIVSKRPEEFHLIMSRENKTPCFLSRWACWIVCDYTRCAKCEQYVLPFARSVVSLPLKFTSDLWYITERVVLAGAFKNNLFFQLGNHTKGVWKLLGIQT